MSKIPVTLTMDSDVKDQGQKKAKDDDRSFSAYVQHLIKEDTKKRQS